MGSQDSWRLLDVIGSSLSSADHVVTGDSVVAHYSLDNALDLKAEPVHRDSLAKELVRTEESI